MGFFYSFYRNITQKKDLSADMIRKDLKRVLTLSDLTFLAIGSMVGSGLYVLTGSVTRDTAGPSIVLSYVIAAIASSFSAVCYAEFAARIPVTGSAYQFTYLCIGEIWAFIVGWAVYIEHVVIAAAVARAWSGYIDGMFGHPIKKYLETNVPMAMSGGLLATYPDFLAGALIIFMTIIVACGVRLSSKFNIVFAALNLSVVVFIICTGLYLARIEYWTNEGGFLPFGWSGTISGASTLIFSYVGYEVIASATEESVRPKRDVPLSLFIALIVSVVSYVGASASLTLMVPWYNVSVESPFPLAYRFRGWNWAQYVVSVGALAAMTATLLSVMLVVPRYLYAMARDGLLFLQCGRVGDKSGVPVVATLSCGVLCLICTLLFGLSTLVEFIAIGQLTANTFVSICVVKLRYEPNCVARYENLSAETLENKDGVGGNGSNAFELQTSSRSSRLPTTSSSTLTAETNLTDLNNSNNYQSTGVDSTVNPVDEQIFSTHGECGVIKAHLLQSRFSSLFRWTTRFYPGAVPFYSLLVGLVASLILTVMFFFGHQYLNQWWFIIILIIFFFVSFASLFYITAFNQDRDIKTFKVPLVPFVPFISIVINIILAVKLKPVTWIRYFIWLAVGLVIYAVYGYRNSVARKNN